MPRMIDLTGQTYGRLTVERAVKRPGDRCIHWECRCSCGRSSVVGSGNLRNGQTKSCGCLMGRAIKHGLSGDPRYNIWLNMIDRCHDASNSAYKRYGGRGIGVCDRWRFGEHGKPGIECFIGDVGERPPGMSLDRWPDKDGDYEPANVRWATTREQANNTRSNRLITHDGVTLTLTEWARRKGLHWATLHTRLGRLGWPVARALEEPRR